MVVTFKKAKEMASAFKAALYGSAGSGKTFTALLWAEGLAKRNGKRIAVIDTEMGTRWYGRSIPERTVHPGEFDFDVLHTRSVSDAIEAIEGIDTDVYGVVIVDSMSHLWDAAQDAVKSRTSAGTIKLQDWGKVKRPLKRMMDLLLGLQADVMILGRQKNVFEENTEGDLRKVGVTMRAEGETPYEPDLCLRMEAKPDTADPSRTTYLAWVEKDRSGILAGKTLVNADYATIGPLVAYLGSGHESMNGSGADAAEKDAEMVAEDDAKAVEKRRVKAEKSAGLFAEHQGVIAGSEKLEDLVAAAKGIKKVRRYMTDEHRAALLLFYEEKRKTLVEAVAGEAF